MEKIELKDAFAEFKNQKNIDSQRSPLPVKKYFTKTSLFSAGFYVYFPGNKVPVLDKTQKDCPENFRTILFIINN